MSVSERISLDPAALAGKPLVRGTRLAWDILQNYPGLAHEDLMACLAYARDSVSSEKMFPSAA